LRRREVSDDENWHHIDALRCPPPLLLAARSIARVGVRAADVLRRRLNDSLTPWTCGWLHGIAWQNDAVESLKVDEGCVAILYEHGDMAGWHAILGPGEHDSAELESAGAKPNDLSSLVVVAGTEQDAQAAHKAIEVDHENMVKREAHQLTELDFDLFVTAPENKMVVVDFYAPWCHWCQILEPTWKAVAREAPEKVWGKDTKVTKVNCEENRELCMKHNIRAYPTINIYMGGSTTAEESYYGDRTTAAIFKWIEHEHKVINVTLAARELDSHVGETLTKESLETPKGHAHLRQKGDKGKLIGVEGCAIKGYVEAKRVPGNFHLQFTHQSFNFENALINATHSVHHFSFGTPLPKATRRWIEMMESKLAVTQLHGIPHPHALFMESSTLDATVFVSDHIDRTYEHYIQVIPTIYKSQWGSSTKT
jgi:thiol-disulfide isomerase/thioredoxin